MGTQRGKLHKLVVNVILGFDVLNNFVAGSLCLDDVRLETFHFNK